MAAPGPLGALVSREVIDDQPDLLLIEVWGIDNPDLVGVTSYVFDAGEETIGVDFGADRFSLYGGCLRARTYDGLGASGTAVVSHRYRNATDASMGEGAIVLNSSPAENWNPIFTAFPWSDLRDPGRVPTSPQPETLFLQRVLGAVLPVACVLDPTPTGVVGGSEAKAWPRVSAMHANVPNPFNPATRIRFDLAQDGRVTLRVYDAAGRADTVAIGT